MIVEAQLTREQFRRLSLLRHFQRAPFYIWASVAAGLTAIATVYFRPQLILVGWVPFLAYVLVGLVSAVRGGRDRRAPYFLPTRYDLSPKGVEVKTERGGSHLAWSDFTGSRKMVGCYVLTLRSGAILAIPQEAVPPRERPRLEALLDEKLTASRGRRGT